MDIDYENDSEIIDEEYISYDVLSDQEIIEQFNEVDSFLKVVDEEINKTDVGDTVEQGD